MVLVMRNVLHRIAMPYEEMLLDVLLHVHDPWTLRLIEAEVRKQGWSASTVSPGMASSEQIHQFRPAVIVLDQRFPDRDGFEVCRQLRADPKTVALPVVLLTSAASSASWQQGFRVCANATLDLPVAPENVVPAIQAALDWQTRLTHEQVRAEVELELASQARNLLHVSDYLEGLSSGTSLSHQQIVRLCHAFLEIGQNAIEWGHAGLGDRTVRVWFRAHEDRVEVVVQDDGPGYDPLNLPHAASPDDPLRHLSIRERLGLRDGGFGLLIARGLVDELRLEHRGNLVTLVMQFSRDHVREDTFSHPCARLPSP